MKKTNIGGIISNTVIAIVLPERAIPPAEIDDIICGSVLYCSLKIVPAVLIVHILWKEKSIIVIQAGFKIGIIIFQNIYITPAPSILAASIKASGTDVSINCFIRKQPVADGIAGRI